jgi:putative endonuclease
MDAGSNPPAPPFFAKATNGKPKTQTWFAARSFILLAKRRMPFITLVTKGYNLDMYYVYVLQSEHYDQYYFGSTKDLMARLAAHNKGQNYHTSKYKPWKIIWYGAFQSKTTALNFEKYLKTASGKAFLRKRLL